MKRLTIAICLLALTLAALSCGPSSGVVLDKDFTPAHSEIRFQQMTDANGNLIGMYPVTDYYPNEWSLRLRNCTDETKCKTGWRSVSHGMYEQAQVGGYVDLDKGIVSPPYVQSRYVQTVPPRGAKVVDRDALPHDETEQTGDQG